MAEQVKERRSVSQAMSLVDRALPRLETVLNEVRSLAQDLQFDRTDRQHLVLSALLATEVEVSVGIEAALKAGNGTSAYVLFRSLLEGYVDLINVSQDSGYLAYMDAALLDQKRRLLVAVVERGSRSPFLAELEDDPGAEEQLEYVRERLRELKVRGIEPLTVKDRFVKANQLDYYEGPYAHLCWHSHNSINILEWRHLRLDEDSFVMAIGAALEDSDVQIIVDTTAGLAANSIAAAKILLEGGSPTGLNDLGAKLEEVRKLWKSNA